MGMVKKICEYCGKEYEMHAHKAKIRKHCNRECRFKAQRGKNHFMYKPKVKMVCTICSKDYEVIESKVNTSKYCSPKCFHIEHDKNMKKMFFTEEHRRKISEANKGRKMSKEWIQKLSDSHKGQKIKKETIKKILEARKGYKPSDETKKKIRLAMIERKNKQLKNGDQMAPFFNYAACNIFAYCDQYIFESEGVYATNGGEYYIKDLGYWLDYINFGKKIIIEYDEKYHYRNEKAIEKTISRQNNIKKYYPEYKFIIIKEE